MFITSVMLFAKPIFPFLLGVATILTPLSSAQSEASSNKTCSVPTGFTNTLVRAPTPKSPILAIKFPFLTSHILFSIVDFNTKLSQSNFAQFCLDQCIAHQPGSQPIVVNGSSIGGSGPCRSFTVDMGVPQPGAPDNGNATALRWWCEGFDAYFKEDLSDFEEFEGEGSYMYGLAVNRGCASGTESDYRFF